MIVVLRGEVFELDMLMGCMQQNQSLLGLLNMVNVSGEKSKQDWWKQEEQIEQVRDVDKREMPRLHTRQIAGMESL